MNGKFTMPACPNPKRASRCKLLSLSICISPLFDVSLHLQGEPTKALLFLFYPRYGMRKGLNKDSIRPPFAPSLGPNELLSVALLHGRLGLVRKLMRRIWLMGRLEQAGKTGGEKGRVSVFRNI